MYNDFEAIIDLKWDIFDVYWKMSEQLIAYEEMRIARQWLKANALNISSQAWENFYNLKSVVYKLVAAREAEDCALEAFNYTKEAYTSGLSSFIDLSTFQSALSLARKGCTLVERSGGRLSVIDLCNG